MKSKKLFNLTNLYLNLPDDFEGNTTDALRLILNYREKAEASNKINVHDDEKDNFNTLWFDDTIKCTMSSGFAEYDEENNSWKYDLDWVK
jgi:hypothetical protein